MEKSHSSARLRLVAETTTMRIATNRLERSLNRLEEELHRPSSQWHVDKGVGVSIPPAGKAGRTNGRVRREPV
jgi:hypothetical protein